MGNHVNWEGLKQRDNKVMAICFSPNNKCTKIICLRSFKDVNVGWRNEKKNMFSDEFA